MSNKLVRVKDYANNQKNQPVVSVINWVFNQSDFIEASLDSILNQKVDFPIEIIVQDDASTDATRDILDKYIAQYPNVFNCILNKENKYSNGEDITTPPLIKASGKYIALTHGDDYWTDPLKLQKQVDFLEQNKSYSMVCSNVEIIDNLGFFKRKRFNFKNSFDIDAKYLLKNNHITTCTVMANSSILQLRKPIKINFADKHIWLTLLENGKCFYLNEITARYRMHNAGIYSLMKESSKSIKRIEDYNIYRKEFPSFYKTITLQIYKNLLRGIISSIKHRNYKEFKQLIKLVFFK